MTKTNLTEGSSRMIATPDPSGAGRRLSRRAALLAPLALGGCGMWDDWFGTRKPPLPGKREPVLGSRRGLTVDPDMPKVTLPPAVRNAAWPQAQGNPAHLMGHLAVGQRLAEAWRSNIGEGGGYRAVIMAQPVSESGKVYTMDSDAVVSAFNLSTGARLWRVDAKPEDADSTNIGGGLAIDGGVLYASTGLSEVLAIDPAKGAIKWRRSIGVPARSAPTVAEGRIFVTTIEDRLLAMAVEDGRPLWSHRATNAITAILGEPAPAYARGLVVAGFGSGELAALRADSGAVVWTDGLGAGRSRTALADFLSIRGAPVISNGRVFAIGMGGLAVGIDLPTGRRLWERQIAGEDSPWVAGDWMFVISLDQELAAINIQDGRVAWIAALPRWEDPDKQKNALTWFGPTLAGDRLVVTGRNEEALAVSPYSGEIIGRQALSAAAAPVPPIVVEGSLLVVTDDGRLLALR
jgi:outer membrane protein assembly factor BamB